MSRRPDDFRRGGHHPSACTDQGRGGWLAHGRPRSGHDGRATVTGGRSGGGRDHRTTSGCWSRPDLSPDPSVRPTAVPRAVARPRQAGHSERSQRPGTTPGRSAQVTPPTTRPDPPMAAASAAAKPRARNGGGHHHQATAARWVARSVAWSRSASCGACRRTAARGGAWAWRGRVAGSLPVGCCRLSAGRCPPATVDREVVGPCWLGSVTCPHRCCRCSPVRTTPSYAQVGIRPATASVSPEGFVSDRPFCLGSVAAGGPGLGGRPLSV